MCETSGFLCILLLGTEMLANAKMLMAFDALLFFFATFVNKSLFFLR